MTIPYLKVAQEGRNQWWYYWLGIVVIPMVILVEIAIGIAIGIVIAALALGVSLNEFKNRQNLLPSWSDSAPWGIYLIQILMYGGICVSLFIALERLHRRSIRTVISADQTFQLKRFWAAFGLWFLISTAFTAIDYFLHPQAFAIAFDPKQWLVCLPFAAVYVINRAFAAELMRGYVLQGLGLLTRRPSYLVSISALLIGLISLSVGQPQTTLFQLLFSAGLALFILQDSRLEINLGIQAAISSFALLAQNKFAEEVNLPTLLIKSTDQSSVWTALGLVILMVKLAAVYYLLLNRGAKPKSAESTPETAEE